MALLFCRPFDSISLRVLYRSALRTARRAPQHARVDLRQAMREEMEKNRHWEDQTKIRFLLSEGLQRLKELNDMLDIQGHRS